MRRVLGVLATYILLSAPVAAQEPQSPFTLQVTTQLTVRTVSVKDTEGIPIEGLTAADFLVTEDGVPQTISIFEFQKMDDTRLAPALLPSARSNGEPVHGGNGRLPGNSTGIRYRNRRLLAFYFDMGALQDVERRRALVTAQEFVQTQMAVVDLVAILTYSEGAVRLAADFTGDRARLLETIRALLDRRYRDDAGPAFGQNDGEFNIFGTDRRLMALQTAERMLGVLNEPKALIYFSSGVGLDVGNHAQLSATLNAAVRANVSIFPIDARGLSALAPMGDASQRSPGGIGMYTGASSMGAMRVFQRSQDALYTLAADTGGKALLDSNDLTRGIIQAQRAISSHYIIGYYPTNTAQDGRLRRLRISLKGRPANLSYREAYYANKAFSKFTNADKERQLEDALLLDDPITEMTMAMELNYFRMNSDEYFVPLAVQIPGTELMLAQKAGAKRTVVDFIAEIKDQSGATITNLRDKVEIRLDDKLQSRLASSPIQYDAGFTLRPGKYVMKFLARNADTGRIGTYQTAFVVPDLNDDQRLPISSVVLSSQQVALSEGLYDVGHGGTGAQTTNPLFHGQKKLIPSVSRVFSKERPLYVYLEAYERNWEASAPVVAFATLYRNGKEILETPPFEINDAPKLNSMALPVKLTIPLGELSPGEYTFQVTVLHPAEQKVAYWQIQILVVP